MHEPYYVMFQVPTGSLVNGCNGKVYGTLVPSYDRKRYKVRKGFVPVEDAIYPVFHEVKKSDLTECSFEEYGKHLQTKLAKALEASNSLPRSVMPGKIFRIAVGDGYAWYVVTKVHGHNGTCDVEHRGFCVDKYFDHYYGVVRKNVKITDVLPHVKSANGLKIFIGKGL